jgi:SAM-dependent methyltransferase
MNWKIKASVQGVLSIIPGGATCNYFLQRNLGQLRSDSMIHNVFEYDVTVIFERMARFGLDPNTSRIFEIGTGWLPVFPLSLALAGFRNIHTVDLHPHLRGSAARRTLLALSSFLDHPSFQPFANPDQVHSNYQRLSASQNILAAAGIEYTAPCNAASTGFGPGSFDLITSNNVFEHVPSPALLELFAEAKRLLRPGGHVLHCINCGDHYAYADRGVTQVNYLAFQESEWKRWNNSIHYQNRLRPIDFIEMADERGLHIESAEYSTNPVLLKQVETMELAPEFRHYPARELASTSLTLIASA